MASIPLWSFYSSNRTTMEPVMGLGLAQIPFCHVSNSTPNLSLLDLKFSNNPANTEHLIPQIKEVSKYTTQFIQCLQKLNIVSYNTQSF